MTGPVEVTAEPNPALAAFLGERLYEFNVEVTGHADGTSLSAAVEDEDGALIAGLVGHTWGGCCWVSRVWVAAHARGRGLGADLMVAAEAEARRRGCGLMLLATHSFQAGGFYERLGFERAGVIEGYPRGHAWLTYTKRLDAP